MMVQLPRFGRSLVALLLAAMLAMVCSTHAAPAPLVTTDNNGLRRTVTRVVTVVVTRTVVVPRPSPTTFVTAPTVLPPVKTTATTVLPPATRTATTPASSATATSKTAAAPTPTAPAPAPSGPRRVIGYLSSGGAYRNPPFVASDIPASKLTHVVYAFANVDAAGNVAAADPWADLQKPFAAPDGGGGTVAGQMALLAAVRAANPNLRTLISIGGWLGSSHFSTISASPATRQAFAQSAVAFMVANGFDGIDLDWEYPGRQGAAGNTVDATNDGPNFTKLLAAVRAEMARVQAQRGRAEPYLLTAATAAGPAYYSALDLRGMAAQVDWVHCMTYDDHGPWNSVTGTNAGVPFVNAAIDGYAAAGLPPAKFALGVAYYARAFAHVQFKAGANPAAPGVPFSNTPASSVPGTSEPGVVEYDDLVAHYLPPGGAYTTALDAASDTTVTYSVAAGVWMSGEDARSAQRKGALAAARGLAGVFAWDLAMDRGAVLTSAVRRGLLSGNGVSGSA